MRKGRKGQYFLGGRSGEGRPSEFLSNKVRNALAVSTVVLLAMAIGFPVATLHLRQNPSTDILEEPVKPPPVVKTLSVVKAVRDIPLGSPIDPRTELELEEVPEDYVFVLEKGGRTVLRNPLEAAGTFAAQDIPAGAYILDSNLDIKAVNPLTVRLPSGMRAVTIKLDDVTGIEGWGNPGARVDVLWIQTLANGERAINTIVEDVSVLSVMGNTDYSSASTTTTSRLSSNKTIIAPREKQLTQRFTVTLAVTAREGKLIVLAADTGKLNLLLRGNETAAEERDKSAVTARELLNMIGDNVGHPTKPEGLMKVKRSDGTFDEWMVLDGEVVKWERADESSAPTNVHR
jgi:Flp pilus assembly protein CpaB